MNIKQILLGLHSWIVSLVSAGDEAATANFRGTFASPDFIPDVSSGYTSVGGSRKPTMNDFMVVEPGGYDTWDEGDEYVVGYRVSFNGDVYICISAVTGEGPHLDPDLDDVHWKYWFTEPETEGTYLYRYMGDWDTDGIFGWKPEFMVNREFTVAQRTALNSGITSALRQKLSGLPDKPVSTASQSLSSAEKEQARTNIGATAPEVFWAVYGSTTHAEVAAAVSAGKVVMMRYNNKDYLLVVSNTASNVYFSCLYNDLLYSIYLSTGNMWGAENYARVQQVANLVTSWQATPDNTHYPAEKLVYDSLGKRGVISQTQTWTRAADGGSDYAMSDLVFGLIPQANIDLFESAGATFNETTGYFELNGLTDLSYEEMQKVMRYDLQNQAPVGNYKLRARTNLAPDVMRYYQNYYTWNAYAFNQNNSTCEVLNLGEEGEENISQKRFFYVNDPGTTIFMVNNHHVKSVYGVIDLENIASINSGFFQNCESLERILLYGVKANLSSLAGSPRLSLASVVFMVENSKNTSAISITLHATAYARCVADTTEYTYQGNTYTGIVAYANAKQITIASA